MNKLFDHSAISVFLPGNALYLEVYLINTETSAFLCWIFKWWTFSYRFDLSVAFHVQHFSPRHHEIGSWFVILSGIGMFGPLMFSVIIDMVGFWSSNSLCPICSYFSILFEFTGFFFSFSMFFYLVGLPLYSSMLQKRADAFVSSGNPLDCTQRANSGY